MIKARSVKCYNIVKKNRVLKPSELITSWQKFAIFIPKNTRNCLAKQDQAGVFSVGYS